MQKIRPVVLEQMIRARLTSAEVNFLVYISQYQDDTGLVSGVYYKEICEKLEISYQKFYDVKESLIRKGLIRAEKNSYCDWDIRILQNDFSDHDYSSGYLSTNHQIFQNAAFFRMKAGAKVLAMHLLRICQSNRGHYRIGVVTFYETYQKLFGVTKRVLQNYLTELRQFFSVGIREHLYFITPKKNVYRQTITTVSETERYNQQIGSTICRRLKIREYSGQNLKDTAALLTQYAQRLGTQAVTLLSLAVQRSLEKLNERVKRPHQRKRELQPKLVHRCLTEILMAQGI